MGFRLPHPGRSGFPRRRRQSRVLTPMTQTHTLGGWRHQSVWAPGSSGQFPGWFSNSSLQVCGQEWGRGSPGHVGEPKGAGDRRATLALGPRASPLGTGLDVPITAAPCGTRKLSGTGPRADGSPVHFLCTWTLAYSEKDGSGLGVGCLGARLRCTMSRSA